MEEILTYQDLVPALDVLMGHVFAGGQPLGGPLLAEGGQPGAVITLPLEQLAQYLLQPGGVGFTRDARVLEQPADVLLKLLPSSPLLPQLSLHIVQAAREVAEQGAKRAENVRELVTEPHVHADAPLVQRQLHGGAQVNGEAADLLAAFLVHVPGIARRAPVEVERQPGLVGEYRAERVGLDRVRLDGVAVPDEHVETPEAPQRAVRVREPLAVGVHPRLERR